MLTLTTGSRWPQFCSAGLIWHEEHAKAPSKHDESATCDVVIRLVGLVAMMSFINTKVTPGSHVYVLVCAGLLIEF